MNHVKLSVPLDSVVALRAAAEFFTTLYNASAGDAPTYGAPAWLSTADAVPASEVPPSVTPDPVVTVETPAADHPAPELPPDRAGDPALPPELDSAGMPWDERIHASTRATVADGTWRKKRGVDSELVDAVTAEIAPVTDATPRDASPPPPPPPVVDADAEGGDGAIRTFPDLMQAITQRGIELPEANEMAQRCGLAAIALAGAEPDKIPALAAEIETWDAVRGRTHGGTK